MRLTSVDDRINLILNSRVFKDDELRSATLLADYSYEFDDVIPLIEVVDAQAALDCHRYRDLCSHLCHNLRDQLRSFHQNCAEGTFLDFVRRTAVIDVNLIVAEFLAHLGSLPHSERVIPAQLADDRMLVLTE